MTIGLVGSTYFNGTLNDLRVYNRVLSAMEVKRLYTMGSGSSGPLKCGSYSVTDPASSTLHYGTVLGADGNCWLDRNLGASRVAQSSTDYLAYGSLYQWVVCLMSPAHHMDKWYDRNSRERFDYRYEYHYHSINNLFILEVLHK